MKFSRLRHQTNSSLHYHRSRVCVRDEVRNGEIFKELANKRWYLRPKRSKAQKKDNILQKEKRKESRNLKRKCQNSSIF